MKTRFPSSRYIFVFALFWLQSCSPVADNRDNTILHAAAVATAHPAATQAGIDILEKGGNAFDAAVAITAALAVVEPYSSGIGGGGFWLIHKNDDDRTVMIDGRERAPLAAHRDMYLDKSGEVIPKASIDGPLAAGIPGVPAAMAHLSEKYGVLDLETSLAPSISLAEQGFEVEDIYRRLAAFRKDALAASASAAEIFLRDGEVPPAGALIKQPELAATLRAIADDGHDGFYAGNIARSMVDDVRRNGGIWSLRDLEEYRVVERDPIRFEYRGMSVTSVPPPSSGGVALAQILNIYDGLVTDETDADGKLHALIESMRRAYRDRAEFLGDTDFVDVPISRLVSREHANKLASDIDMTNATASDALSAVSVDSTEGADTTHFSVVDKQGNMVSATLSINYPFGSGFVAEGTGVLLNDEMDDFSSRPGTPNVYGLVGAEANAIEPGKRMLSSMSPSFASLGNRDIVLGTPGGSRIITMVLLGLLEFHEGGDAKAVVSRPRVHHQYLPDKVFYEPEALTTEQLDALQLLGHQVSKLDSSYGNMHAIIVDKKTASVDAASDPRGIGSAVVLD